jgi:DNA-binding transcriptional ArsR family regulator
MKNITVEMSERVAARFRALGDPTRIRILDVLRGGERSVGDLAELLAVNQASMSKHLALLREEGLIGVRRLGTQALYRISDPSLDDLCALVCDGVRRHAEARHSALTR